LLGQLSFGVADAANTTVDGKYAGTGMRAAGSVLQLPVTGRGGVPGNAKAVALNLTITQPAATGYATVYPCGTKRPNASTINFKAGTTIANGVLAKVGTNGRVCIYTHRAAHLVVDVVGDHPAASAYSPLTPARLLDTRSDDPHVVAAEHSLALLNQLRVANGRNALILDPNMSATALSWSQQMSLSGFRHSGGPYAENIAWHSASWMTPVEAASTLHRMWVDSPGHLANMLDPRWTRVGIGMHNDAGGWWGTHVFA
jgi:hypothetical protein